MKILALEIESPGNTDLDFEPHLAAEARRVWELYSRETIREIYFRADRKSAVLILECVDLKEAEEVLATLPLVRAGLIRFDLIPLAPYPGYRLLFAPEEGDSGDRE